MMGVLRFQAKSSYKSVLKLSALSVMVAVLSGCGKDSNNDSSSFLATIWNKNNTAQVVLTGTAIDDPIFNGTVKVMTPDGVEIGKATTKVDGTFSVSVAESFLSAPILLQVSGGTMAGQPFTGTLKAIYTSQDGRTGLNLTPVTTLVSHLANAESGSDLAAKRNTVLNKLTALGMVDLQSWRKVTDTPFDLGTIAFRISDLGGITQWVNTVQADIADGELSKDEMMMGFPKAHGGVQKVVMGMDSLSLTVGDKRTIQVSADGVSENTKLTIALENAPEWIKVNNGVIVLEVPENAQAGVRQSFSVVVSANGVPVGRKKALSVYVTPMTLLLEGSLGVAGGKIENQWKEIVLSAPAGVLKQQYTFKYYAGVDDSGRLLSRYKTTPEVTVAESAALNLVTPDSETLIANYLTDTATPAVRSRTTQAPNKPNDEIPTTCKNNNVWPDRNKDGFIFDNLLQGTEASYYDANGLDKFGFTRIYAKKYGWDDVTQCSSRLWAAGLPTIIPTNDTKEPILFVHGFIMSGELGGFDDGEEYFAKFPQLIYTYDGGRKYQPYLFEWRTNARFEDVAEELGKAVNLIHKQTGKKVRIVAHSYGGLLSRTLIQGLAANPDPNGKAPPTTPHPEFTREWAEQHIATLTTVGTPHSGVSNGSQNDGLPNGRHGRAGYAIRECNAITCYQAGRSESEGDVFSAEANHDNSSKNLTSSGEIIFKLRDTKPYPTGIFTQILIGLGGTRNLTVLKEKDSLSDLKITCSKTANGVVKGHCRLFYSREGELKDQGDGLISFFGQRFYPQMLGQPLINGSNLKEHILGFDNNSSVALNAFDKSFLENSAKTFSGRDVVHESKRQHLWDVGIYNHRTGQYVDKLKTDGDSSGSDKNGEDLEISIKQFSEVGLQNCSSSTDCPHATWKYFVAEALPVSVKSSVVLTDVNASGRLGFPTTATARAVGGAVPAGSWVRIHANGRMLTQVDLNSDGSFNVPVEFVANTNYTLRIHSPGYRAKFINGEDFGATTGATVAESSLNFGVIEMETLPFAAGDMKVVVTNAVTGRSVTGYKVTAYNSVNNITGKKEEADTVANPTPTLTTLPKGYHRLEVSKDGYEIAKQMCYAKENQLTTCQINIVPKASVSAGQLLSVLRWDVNPRDLDSHLFKYDANGNRVYQIYYANQVSGADSLDVDDTDSYGPETVTINQLDPKANYVYAIHHFAGSGSITTTSQAQVSVLQNGKPVRIYKAPLAGFGGWWKVFEIKNGQVIPCQQDCMFSTAPQPTARSIALPTPRSIALPTPRWLLDAMSAPMPPKK